MDEDLGNDPTLPKDLTTFLEGAVLKRNEMTLQVPLLPCPWIPHICLVGGPPAPSYPHKRGSPKGPCKALHCLIPIPVSDQRDAGPSKPPLPMDQGRDGQGRRPPLLVEGGQGHQKVHPRECPQKLHHR